MKITLTKEMETLLIPLYGRAIMSKKGILKDNFAEAAVELLDYPFKKLRIPNKTNIMLSIRCMIIDDFTLQFLSQNPQCTVIYLGCGFDARYNRLVSPKCDWYDLDYPEVIDLKKKLYEETEYYHFIGSSVTENAWIQEVKQKKQEVLIIAEGLLMYLDELEIKGMFHMIEETFHSVTYIFDAYSKATVKLSDKQPSLQRTGAEIKWGVDSALELADYFNSAKVIDTAYLTEEAYTHKFGMLYHTLFNLAGKSNTAKEAHRVFIVR